MDSDEKKWREKQIISLSLIVFAALTVFSSYFLIEGISIGRSTSALMIDVLPGFGLALLVGANTWRLKRKFNS